MTKYIASVSFGKDSLAMLLKLIELDFPLDEVVFFDTGKEFQAIYDTRDAVLQILKEHGIKYTELYPPKPFFYYMFSAPVKHRGDKKPYKYGYSWCGNKARWMTAYKTSTIKRYFKKNKYTDYYQYIGIAADEDWRTEIGDSKHKLYPLIDLNMTEADCLQYCYDNGFNFIESGKKLYEIVDRASCWCCRHKTIKELKNIYTYLPDYWEKLKYIQLRLDEPMKGGGVRVCLNWKRDLKMS